MECLLADGGSNPHRVRSRSLGGIVGDANVFRTQREKCRTIRQSNPPPERVTARHSILYFTPQQIGVANELSGIGSGGVMVDLARRGDLFQFSLSQQRDAIRHDHGFLLIMGDKDERDANFALQGFQFDLHLATEVGIERGERLVEQEQARPIHQCPGQGDALLLAAADLGGFRTRKDRHLHHGQCLFDARLNFGFRQLGDAQAIAHVVLDRQVGEKRVVLKDGVDAAAIGRE